MLFKAKAHYLLFRTSNLFHLTSGLKEVLISLVSKFFSRKLGNPNFQS